MCSFHWLDITLSSGQSGLLYTPPFSELRQSIYLSHRKALCMNMCMCGDKIVFCQINSVCLRCRAAEKCVAFYAGT